MKRFLLSLITVIPLLIVAENVTPEQASQAASNFLIEKGINHQIKESGTIQNSEATSNLIYIFDILPQGFILISGDNNSIPVLGFSLENNFFEENIAPPVNEWIEFYKNQIQFGRNLQSKNTENNQKWQSLLHNTGFRKSVSQVGPLTSSKWHQGGPYNQSCPYDEECGNLHTPAGCVAIAMAQVMYYYRFPDYGAGSFSYNPPYNANMYGTLSADFENTIYEWDNMVSDVLGSNTSVANLISHCGISTKMDYQQLGSGTPTGLIKDALIDYFKYSPNISFESKTDYSDADWYQLLRDNLDKNQVMVYRGSSGWQGHAWVCDGYMDSVYFHFNWGWGGSQNGFFAIDAINVSGYDFSGTQQALVNIYPDTSNYAYPEIVEDNFFTSPSGSFTDGSKAENYSSNFSGNYRIDLSEQETSSIILQFDYIQTEENKDIIEVYAGENESGNLLATLSGQMAGYSIEIPGSQVFIKFLTDDQNNMNGWLLSYHSTPYCSTVTLITDGTAVISDGSGSLPYYQNSDCRWLIQPQSNPFDSVDIITLQFLQFEIADGDELRIYNGPDEEAELFAVYSGGDQPDYLDIPNHEIFIHFYANSGLTEDGWMLKYSTSPPVYCSDTTRITDMEGFLNDGSVNNKYYEDYSDCYWLISPPDAEYIELDFTSFDVELYYDYVEVFDPSTSPPTKIAHLTGYEIPESVRTENGQMLIHFSTDYAIQKQGWEAQYTSGETAIYENALSAFKLYPNPANDKITLSTTPFMKPDYIIYNMLGKQILKGQLHANEIDIKSLESGIYFLKLKDSDFQKTMKFIKV